MFYIALKAYGAFLPWKRSCGSRAERGFCSASCSLPPYHYYYYCYYYYYYYLFIIIIIDVNVGIIIIIVINIITIIIIYACMYDNILIMILIQPYILPPHLFS